MKYEKNYVLATALARPLIAKKLVEGDDFTKDEKQRAIQLTDKGIEKAERELGLDNIYTDAGIKYVHHLETAVRAKSLFERDRHYVVRDNEVVIVDEFTLAAIFHH